MRRIVSARHSTTTPVPAAALRPASGDTHLALLSDEREWVDRIRRGDEAAFGTLFRAYFDPLCRFVESFVRRPAVAEELVQDLFLSVWDRRETWVVHETLRTYLYVTARNRALNHLRHERVAWSYLWQRWLRSGAAPAAGALTMPEAEARLAADETEAVVRRAIAALPPRYRTVVQLRWDHGMTYAEIARVLDMSVKTVETRASRALRMLRPALETLKP